MKTVRLFALLSIVGVCTPTGQADDTCMPMLCTNHYGCAYPTGDWCLDDTPCSGGSNGCSGSFEVVNCVPYSPWDPTTPIPCPETGICYDYGVQFCGWYYDCEYNWDIHKCVQASEGFGASYPGFWGTSSPCCDCIL